MAEDKAPETSATAAEATAEAPKTTDEPSKVEDTVTDDKKESKTLQDMKNAFKKMGTSTSQVMKTSIKTLRNIEGKTKNTDDYVDGIEDGLKHIKARVDLAKLENKAPEKWDFAAVPCAIFEKTLDDVFVAFLKWAIVEQDDNGKKADDETTESLVGKINVSKAFRRLESYASWMHANAANLENLATESVQDAWGAWKLKISYDKSDRLVWWMDVGAMDVAAVKARDLNDTLRLFVWFAHLVLFDTKAQDNGMVFAESMGQIKFWSGMTIVPPKLSLKLDRLTIGVLPVKMKKLYILESPVWCDLMVNTLKAFVSKKVKSRIVILKEAAVLEEELGKDCIPASFATCDGKLTTDIVAEKHFPNLPKQETKKEEKAAVDPETSQI